jgi:hypothetical protein
MRTLAAPPGAVVGPSGSPALGSYRGPLPRVDWSPLRRPLAYRITHRKKWIYAAATTEEVFAAVAVIDVGYATKAFAFACADGRMLADRTSLGPPGAGAVGNGMGEGALARYTVPGARVGIARRGGSLSVDARFRGLTLAWTMDTTTRRPPISAIGALPGGAVNATEKQALLETRGTVRAGGETRSLGGFGGYDYTHGYLARRTRWRWAFFMGRAHDGTPIAMNLVEGFVGEPECALWIGDELVPIGEGRFALDRSSPLDRWRVRSTCDSVDLSLLPWDVHGEDTNLGLVKANFIQPIGLWVGTIRAGGRELRIARALGVAEDQDVLW